MERTLNRILATTHLRHSQSSKINVGLVCIGDQHLDVQFVLDTVTILAQSSYQSLRSSIHYETLVYVCQRSVINIHFKLKSLWIEVEFINDSRLECKKLKLVWWI